MGFGSTDSGREKVSRKSRIRQITLKPMARATPLKMRTNSIARFLRFAAQSRGGARSRVRCLGARTDRAGRTEPQPPCHRCSRDLSVNNAQAERPAEPHYKRQEARRSCVAALSTDSAGRAD